MSGTKRLLMNEFKTLAKEKWVHLELDHEDIFKWKVALIVLNKDSLYYGGYFQGSLQFPKNFPYSPPKFNFSRPLYHPNIYPTGELCISILHSPGEDETSGELAAERWTPAQRVETVLISILSLLDDAEVSSPANVDAAVMLRNNPTRYKSIVREHVELSKKDIPKGFVMPTHESTVAPREEKIDDEYFWAESDADDDVFGGSDSDENMTLDDQDSGSEDIEDDDE